MVSLLHYLIEYFNQAPLIIQLSWITSIALLLSIVILLSYLKYLRARLRTEEKIEATYQKEYESNLIEYLYAGNDEEEISFQQQQIINYFKTNAITGLKRKIFINTLLKLRNEITGEAADAIQQLYYQTGFATDATKKVKSKKWDTVAKAIKELAQFEIKEAHDEIILLINHPKKEVRNEIQMYLVKLFGFEGLEFLDLLENKLSEWNQIQILKILENSEIHNLPDICPWLKSTNDSVVSFAIKLAKIYHQFDTKDEMLLLLEHSNQEIRIEAIEIISDLWISEAIDILKKDINQRCLEEQIAFFKTAEKMFTAADIPFILEYINHDNFDIRVSAQKMAALFCPSDAEKIKINNSDKDSLIKAV